MYFIEPLGNLLTQELPVLLALILTFCWYMRRHVRKSKELAWLGQFPCPSLALPIVGNVYEFAGNPTSKSMILLWLAAIRYQYKMSI
jgi:hypothetical protein